MRKVVAGGAILAASFGVAGGVHLFEQGADHQAKSANLSANLDNSPAAHHFSVANSAEYHYQLGLVDELGGIIIAAVGAGAIFLVGAEIKRTASQS